MRTIIKSLSISVLLIVVFSWGYKAGSQDSAGKPIYRKPIPSFLITLDPKHYHDAYSVLIAAQIYDRLFDIDELLNLKPKLASAWKSLENGKKWVINLRPDVSFHNGKPFNAYDVLFSLKRLIEKDSIKRYEFSIVEGADEYRDGKSKNVSGIKIIDNNTIEITLATPSPLFLSTLAAPNTEIIEADYAGKSEEDYFVSPSGTGPFMLRSIIKGVQVELESNPRYFQGRPKLNTIIFEYADTQKALKGFNTGYYHDLEFYYPDTSRLNKSFTLIRTPQAETNLIVFNAQRPPLNNVHVRKAVALALNKEKLFNMCFASQTYAKGFIPPGLGGYSPDTTELKYNLSLAANELKNAKINKKNLARELIFLRPNNHPCADQFSAFITESMKAIGLNVKVVHVPLDEVISRRDKKDFDLYSATFTADYPEALFMLNMLRSNSSFNPGVMPEFDNLLTQASLSQDKFERYKLYRQAQDILIQNAYIIPLYHEILLSVFQTNVRGLTRHPLTSYLSPMNSTYFAEDTEK